MKSENHSKELDVQNPDSPVAKPASSPSTSIAVQDTSLPANSDSPSVSSNGTSPVPFYHQNRNGTARQRSFVVACVANGGDYTKACKDLGLGGRNPWQAAKRMLDNPWVIERFKSALGENAQFDRRWILDSWLGLQDGCTPSNDPRDKAIIAKALDSITSLLGLDKQSGGAAGTRTIGEVIREIQSESDTDHPPPHSERYLSTTDNITDFEKKVLQDPTPNQNITDSTKTDSATSSVQQKSPIEDDNDIKKVVAVPYNTKGSMLVPEDIDAEIARLQALKEKMEFVKDARELMNTDNIVPIMQPEDPPPEVIKALEEKNVSQQVSGPPPSISHFLKQANIQEQEPE